MKTIGLVVNIKRKEAAVVLKKLITWLKNKKIDFLIDKEAAISINMPQKAVEKEYLPKKTDLIVVLGGDGTLLCIARYAAAGNIPILAVNLGSLGFITEIKVGELFTSLKEIIKHKYNVEKRMMLDCTIIRKSSEIKKYIALNDIVLSREVISRLVHIEIYVNNDYVTTYHADGLLIASPTGSTAYSLSAGGPIIHPEMDALILSPICPHTLTNRPVIIPPDKEIAAVVKSVDQHVVLTVDGQTSFQLIPGDIIKIYRARQRVKLIIPEKRNYYEILRNKLKWGGA